jgi:hypothetical protein
MELISTAYASARDRSIERSLSPGLTGIAARGGNLA